MSERRLQRPVLRSERRAERRARRARSFARRSTLLVVIAATAVAFTAAGSAAAGADPADESTTTTTTAPPTTQAPPSTTQAPAPTSLPPIGPATTVPFPVVPTLPGGQSPDVVANLRKIQQQQQARLAALQREADEAAREMANARQTLDEIDVTVDDVTERIAAVLRTLEKRRDLVRQRAIAAYKGDASYLSVLLEAQSPSDFLTRVKLLTRANRSDTTSIDSLIQQKVELEQQQVQLVGLRRDQRAKIVEMEATQQAITAKLRELGAVLATLPNQQAIAVNGFTFPATPPFTYSDDFGEPRSGPPPRPHEGNDIFCVLNSPLRAAESGTIVLIRDRALGGKSFWLKADSGTGYYYAHLAAYFPGVVEGSRVAPGQYVGFCGNTGNAVTTPPHLHFEIHPGGVEVSPPINPYPILKATEDAMTAQLAASIASGVGQPVIDPATGLAVPAPVDPAAPPAQPGAAPTTAPVATRPAVVPPPPPPPTTPTIRIAPKRDAF